MSRTKPVGPPPTEVAGLAKLYVAVPARVDLGRVRAAFGTSDGAWLGEQVSADEPGIRRFACDLVLWVGPDRRATFRKSAIVGLGEPERDDEGWMIPIEWRAATLAPLFPVFVGRLLIRSDRIELDGRYAPPGGTLGYVLDRALLHIAARGTGRWFIEKVASVLRPTE